MAATGPIWWRAGLLTNGTSSSAMARKRSARKNAVPPKLPLLRPPLLHRLPKHLPLLL